MTEVSAARGSHVAVLAVVVASTFLAMLAYTGLLGNAVTLTAALSASAAQTTWILASMSVGLAVSLLAAGVVADRIGRRRVFELGAVLFIVSSLACTVAPNAGVFITARIVAGVGATGMIATGLGLVVSLGGAVAERHSRTATWWSVAMGTGIAAGPVLSGAFDLVDGWRWFYALLTVGGIAMWIVVRRAVSPQHPASGHARMFDTAGFVLLTAFLALLITAIVEVRGGLTGTTVALFATSALLLTAFVLSQRFGRRRLVAPEILAHRPFLAAIAAGLGAGIGVTSVMAFAPSYLAGGLGMTTLQAGALMTLWAGTSAVAALVFARHTARITGPTQLVIGLVGVAVGMSLMAAPTPPTAGSRFVAGLILAGIASGLLNGGLARQAVASVPATHTATGTAANNTARYLGAAIGVSASSIIASATGIHSGWNDVAWAGAAMSVLMAIVVAILSSPSAKAPLLPRKS